MLVKEQGEREGRGKRKGSLFSRVFSVLRKGEEEELEEEAPQGCAEALEDSRRDVDAVEERRDGWREGLDRLEVWVIHDGDLVRDWDRVELDSARIRFSRFGA